MVSSGLEQGNQRCFFPACVSCPCWPQKNGDRLGGEGTAPSIHQSPMPSLCPPLAPQGATAVCATECHFPQMPGKMQIKGRFGYFSEISNGATHVWSGLSAESAGERSTLKYLHFFLGDHLLWREAPTRPVHPFIIHLDPDGNQDSPTQETGFNLVFQLTGSGACRALVA